MKGCEIMNCPWWTGKKCDNDSRICIFSPYDKMKAQKEVMKSKEADHLIKERITKLRIERDENTPREKLYDTIDMLWEAREKLHREISAIKAEIAELKNMLSPIVSKEP
jgi:DNA gyrase/topoisomerase IV subunit A